MIAVTIGGVMHPLFSRAALRKRSKKVNFFRLGSPFTAVRQLFQATDALNPFHIRMGAYIRLTNADILHYMLESSWLMLP